VLFTKTEYVGSLVTDTDPFEDGFAWRLRSDGNLALLPFTAVYRLSDALVAPLFDTVVNVAHWNSSRLGEYEHLPNDCRYDPSIRAYTLAEPGAVAH